MVEKIREHVCGLFGAYPPDAKITELREEMIADLTEKYRDLLKRGFHEQEAYRKVTEGIGNVDELVRGLTPDARRADAVERWNVGAAIRNALAPSVVLVYLALSFLTGAWGITWILFLMIPFFFCVLKLYRYDCAASPVRGNGQQNSDDVLSGDAPAPAVDRQKLKLIKNAIESGILPFYFIISFLTDWWAVTWLVFLVIPILEGVYRGLKSE